MDVGCSTLCFAEESLPQALRKIADLEFSKVDLAASPDSGHLTPAEIVSDQTAVMQKIRQGPTIGIAALTIRFGNALPTTGEADKIAHLAKGLATPVIVLEAQSSQVPIEEEIDRLSKLERVIGLHGVVLTVVTKLGTLAEDPDNCLKLCEAVPGLGLTFDPTTFLCGPASEKPTDAIHSYIRHVQLRDSGPKKDQLQVQIGRGAIEYSRVITNLNRHRYKGSLIVSLEKSLSPEMELEPEVRKLRLLLESSI